MIDKVLPIHIAVHSYSDYCVGCAAHKPMAWARKDSSLTHIFPDDAVEDGMLQNHRFVVRKENLATYWCLNLFQHAAIIRVEYACQHLSLAHRHASILQAIENASLSGYHIEEVIFIERHRFIAGTFVLIANNSFLAHESQDGLHTLQAGTVLHTVGLTGINVT